MSEGFKRIGKVVRFPIVGVWS